MKLFTFLLLFLSINTQAQVWNQPLRVSGGGGNGGDYIRMKFLEVGNFVLQNYKQGLNQIQDTTSVEQLRSVLNIDVIQLSREPLFDNQGSAVDAIGEYRKILLYEGNSISKTGWIGIFERKELVEKLVLHEILRAAGVNDDNYYYSSKVLKSHDLSLFDSRSYIKWCSQSASFVESSLQQGLRSTTYKEETLVYIKSLKKIERLISPKHFYFIEPSVKGALRIIELLNEDKEKTLFLRIALKQVANDIRYIDKKLKENSTEADIGIGDNSVYARKYLESAREFTILASSAEIELEMLNIVFDQVHSYMVNSDFVRERYAPVFSELDSARYSQVLSYKREALKYIKILLNRKL
ncbi:MAG: hypothetical protein ACI9QD_000558 [Thermoproteota archaeon]|jgi:hypothetical protein